MFLSTGRYFWNQGITGMGVHLAFLGGRVNKKHPDLKKNIREIKLFCSSESAIDGEEDNEKFDLLAIAPDAGLYVGQIHHKNQPPEINALIDGLYWTLNLPVHIIYIDPVLNTVDLDDVEKAVLDEVTSLLKEKNKLVICPGGRRESVFENCLSEDDIPGFYYEGEFAATAACGVIALYWQQFQEQRMDFLPSKLIDLIEAEQGSMD